MRGRLHDPALDFWPRLKKDSSDCWIWMGARKSNGYGHLSIGKGNVQMAHRYAFFLANGKWPKLNACHHCDTRLCCNPAHLYDGTTVENMRDMRLRKRAATGARLPQTKLTQLQADEIRTIYAAGNINMKKLGERFGVGAQTVCDIVNMLRWVH